MQVHLGVLLPADVAGEIAALVASAAEPPPLSVGRQRRGLFGRAKVAPTPSTAGEPAVVPVPAGQMHVSIAAFGNLPTGDVHRLGDRLAEVAAEWPAPRLRCAGAEDADQPGPVAVALDGEVDGLRGIARGVVSTVEGLGLFVDRRRFRPAATVARARAAAGADATEAVERVRYALRGYDAGPWVAADLSLLRMEHDAGADRLAEVRRLRLAEPT